jgi:ubiquinone biosynthesis protein COQ9
MRKKNNANDSAGKESEHMADIKRKILAHALPLVPFDGWTGATLLTAAEEAGLSSSHVLRAFPGGAADAIAFWTADTDRRMLDEFGALDWKSLKIRERVARAVRLRLEHLTRHREAVRRALVLLALPQHAPQALASLYRTVDAIWYAVGDTATDWSFYSKRLLLAGVYSATLLYWLDDKSEGCESTWAFLDRRIDDVMQIQKARAWFDRLWGSVPGPLRTPKL